MNWTARQVAEHEAGLIGEAPKAPKPRMNKWESEYAKALELLRAAGAIEWWAFEPIKLRLADGCYYIPDFAVVINGKLQFHEVKGFFRDDAKVKFRVARETFPFRFVALRLARNGEWEQVL